MHRVTGEKEYDRMMSLVNSLLDAVGDDEDHPLAGLLNLVGDLVATYEQNNNAIAQAKCKDASDFLIESPGDGHHQSNLSAIPAGGA